MIPIGAVFVKDLYHSPFFTFIIVTGKASM